MAMLGLQGLRQTADFPVIQRVCRLGGFRESLALLESATFLDQNTSQSLGYWPDTYLKSHGYDQNAVNYIYTVFTTGDTLDDIIKELAASGMAVAEIIWLWALANSTTDL
jgi:hypothetical protein